MNPTETDSPANPGGPIPLRELTGAWRTAHYAAQAAAELGKAWAEQRADDSHSSLGWVDSPTGPAFEGVPAVGPTPVRARLVVPSLTLRLADGSREHASLQLQGRTLDDALRWARSSAEKVLGPPRQQARPAPDLPDHPIARGAPFAASPALAHLAHLYALTDAVLADLRDADPRFGPARCWPHHFDHASLAVVRTDDAGDMTATIGVGVTPPDPVDPSGYWYVSPWTRADPPTGVADTPLPAGHWLARDTAGPMAVLPLARLADPGPDAALVAAFVSAAVAACDAALRR